MIRRVIFRTDPYAPIFAVYTPDIDQADFNDQYPAQVRDQYPALFRPGVLFLDGFRTTDARADYVAANGWEVVGE